MILIADQRRALAEMLARRFQTEGFEAQVETDAARAFAAALKGVRFAILDPASPVNGLYLLRQLKANAGTAPIPVIILGASLTPDDLAVATKLGAVGCFVKGEVTPLKIIEKVQACLKALTPTPRPVPTPAVPTASQVTHFNLKIAADQLDGARLAQALGFTPGLMCRVCGGPATLRLSVDPRRGLTSGALTCPKHPSQFRPRMAAPAVHASAQASL